MIGAMAKQVVNVSSVPHRSVFRYPGGKTWLVPYIREWLSNKSQRPSEFIEPFAGGGIVGLSVLFDRLAEHLTLIELDDDIAAVWETIVGKQADALATRIVSFELTRENVLKELSKSPIKQLDRAFQTILRNRVQRGGIMAPGAGLIKHGENGNGISSRWYPTTLSKRIRDIIEQQERITFFHDDGLLFIRNYSQNSDYSWFIDPPYTVAGRRLYQHSEIDHEELFKEVSILRGDFLLSYDDVRPIRTLADRYGLDTHLVPMKNTHHAVKSELLIGRDLDWARKPLKFRENSPFEVVKADGNACGQTFD